MKTIRLNFLVFALCCVHSLFAQEEVGNGMVFPQYEQGIVIFKTGVRSSASLNYNMLQEQMLFLEADSSVMAIANPLEILAVVIGERRFLPISSKGVFYEEITMGDNSFFIRRQANMLSRGKAAAYGGYSQTSSTTSYSSWQGEDGGRVVKLKPDEKFELDVRCSYYLKSGNSYKEFSYAKALGKLFKGHGAEIEEFAKNKSINFSKAEDVARIVEYGYSLRAK
jgi:hypothetical protein